MKSDNIVKRLEKEGYKITFKKWGYWNNIPHVQLDGFDFAIAETVWSDGWQSCRVDFIYNHVQEALHIAKNNNPILLKKIEAGWDYGIYLILSMEDYYRYKRKKYPFNEYWDIINKLEKELE